MYPHDNALVITLVIANYMTRRVLIDNGSSANIQFCEAFVRMGIDVSRLRPSPAPLKGFFGDTILPVGTITLPMTAVSGTRTATIMTNFLVVKAPSSYNIILGRPTLNHSRTGWGTGPPFPPTLAATLLEDVEVRDEQSQQHAEVNELLELVALHFNRPGSTIRIGTNVPLADREALKQLLVEYRDIFAWSHEEMTGIDNKVIEHRLGMDPAHKAVCQKRKSFSAEKYAAIKEEVEKLLTAKFIKESHYPEWLSNVVMVKKGNGRWRMCVDFTDLNKACPKGSFPLPRIDVIVDVTTGHRMLSFMDAYSGYNQIRMYPTDEEKTSFITDRWLYCYHVMPFGLKNAGATYQRLVNQMFEEQIDKSMEVYIDNLLVKSKESTQHLGDLRTAFEILRRYKMRLNPAKCAFEVEWGGFWVILYLKEELRTSQKR